jgi:acetolactate synthase-1/2/3 large subunit
VIHDRKRIPEFVATAFRTAMSGRPGPVHLTLPIDIQEQAISEDELPPYLPREYRNIGRPQGDTKLVQEAADLLSRAQKPVIIVGNPANYSVTPGHLEALAEASGIPIFTVEQARGLIDDEHPLCFGYADGALNRAARRFREADVVLLLGKRLDHRYRYGQVFSADAKIIQADPSEAEIGRNRGVSIGLLGDLGAITEQLTSAVGQNGKAKVDPWIAQLKQDREAWLQELRDKATGEQPMHPLDVFTNIEHLVDEDTFIIMDGGDYVQWGRSYLKARKPGHFMRLGPLSHLGAGIPYAMAAKLAAPKSKVLALMGDGSFGFYTMEYDTCIRHNLPITVVLGNDSNWGIDKTFQLAYFHRAVGTDLRFVRYDKVVEAIGGYAEYVEQPEEVGPAVERAFNSGLPSLVNIVVKPGASPLADAMIARRTGR